METLTLTFAELSFLLDEHAPEMTADALARLGSPAVGDQALVRAAGASSLVARQLLRVDEDGAVIGDPALAAITTTLAWPNHVVSVLATNGPDVTALHLLTSEVSRLVVSPRGFLTYRFDGVDPGADTRSVVMDVAAAATGPGVTLTLRVSGDGRAASVVAHRDTEDDDYRVEASSMTAPPRVALREALELVLGTAT